MQSKRQFKLGIVGCGRISQTHIQAIKTCESLTLDAVMDTRPEAARSAAEATGCRAFTKLDDFVAESGVEGCIICAPPVFHRKIACALMDKGIHVLCEKPFATCYQDAVAMMEESDEKDVVLAMASKFRHVEDIIRAKAMITSGMLGEVLFFNNVFCSKLDMRGRWNGDPKVSGGGVLIDNGTHSVDIARYLLGPIETVHVHPGKQVMGLPVEDTSLLTFTTSGGVVGTAYLSWSVNIDQESYIDIFGTEGRLSIGWKESRYQHNGHKECVSFGVGYNKISAFSRLVLNFVDTIRGSAEPVIDDEDALASVKVIETAYQSMRDGALQRVEKSEAAADCMVKAS